MIRMAVIGAGAIGRNHARVCRDNPAVALVGLADANLEVAQTVAGLYGTKPYADPLAMLAEVKPDAVIVAVPTHAHAAVATAAVAAGCHVLVEKPIAATVAEAESIIARAQAADRVLAVGHIERHNPAVRALHQRLSAGELGRVFQIHARRLGPFPARIRDVGVVLDLATHDLDVMRYLTGSEVVRLFAETQREIHTSSEDLFSGLVKFANGTIGVLEINWLTPTKIRELWVTGERGMFRADYLTQDLYFYENAEAGERAMPWETLSVLRGVSEGTMLRYALPKQEPMRAEHEAFIAAIRGEPSASVTGADGLAALRLALALVDSGATHEAKKDL